MRSDMKWIIGDQRGSRVSGPRKGRRFSPAEFRKYDWAVDDTPFVGGLIGHALEKSLIGQRSPRGRGFTRKPLERFLARQVGRLWNDVLSELRTALRGADIAEAHWPYFLSNIVSVRAKVIDQQIVVEDWSGKDLPLSDLAAPTFYVDPRTGRLHRNTSIVTRRMRQKRIEAAKMEDQSARMRVISGRLQLHLLSDGNWWEITLSELDRACELRRDWTDVVMTAGLSDLPGNVLYGRARVYASAKRPLSSKEIKRHHLR